MPENPTTIQFISYRAPLLLSGDYRIDVEQTITVGSTVQGSYARSQEFSVSGNRYSLEAGAVSSVFPPQGASGLYDTILPHIILEHSTFPWQRSVDATNANLLPGNQTPWLALLLIDESETGVSTQQATLADLVQNNNIFFPPRTSEPGEESTQPVNVIDVPLPLFNAVMPTAEDLQWLAHVRKISVRNKSTKAGRAASDTYSVILGNRLPAEGHISTVHLVSLENYGNYLPDSSGNQSTNIPSGVSTMRLVSLYSWSFRCEEGNQTLAGLLNAADMNPPTLQMPFTGTASDSGSQTVQTAFGLGYTAMNHHIRNGDNTVSWYRGPLLPLGTSEYMPLQNQNADQLMRYQPDTGMFDTSYASAWQLGKLLALHDSSYAQTLVRWKAQQTLATVLSTEENILNDTLNVSEQNSGAQSKQAARYNAALLNVVGPAAAKINNNS